MRSSSACATRARSQTAAGPLGHLSGGAAKARSAGSPPGDPIDPVAVEAARGTGVDVTTGPGVRPAR
ncbi:hypothetical protein [Actinorugispora endophytica]|uniref:hypothetical protein n=1 Tax=Actinorugispora endophytica TaxID=1605990 RepID=UPI00105D4E1C|nr:hypothetical protein [Actinorugispora endophytica]